MVNNIDFDNLKEIPTEIVTVDDNDVFGDTVTRAETPGNSYQEPEQPPTPQPEQGETKEMNLGVIPPETVIVMMDSVLPPFLVIVFTNLGYSVVNGKLFKLNAGDKAALTPAIENYLKTINVKLSPFEQLLLTIAFVYSGKVIPILATERKNDDPNSTNQGAPAKKRGRPSKN